MESAILSRAIDLDNPDFDGPSAEAILKLKMSVKDKDRADVLSGKAQLGELSENERVELDDLVRIAHFIALMKSKARFSLKVNAAN